MKRRDVMKLGAVAAGASVGVPGCAVPRMISSMTGADGAARFNSMLDEQLAKVARPGLLQQLIGEDPARARSPEVAAKLAEKDALFRRMLGALLVTQGFRELPVETQIEPAVQERMWSHLDAIDATVFEVGDTLAALDEPTRTGLRKTLGKRQDLPMEIGEMIDAQAASAGISLARRMQLRKMMSQAGFRLRHGDPGSIIDEYVDKVARVRESGEAHGDALHLAKQLGERSFWRYQHMLAQDPGTGAPAPQPPAGTVPAGPPPAPAPMAAPAPVPLGPPSERPLVETLTRGAREAALRGDCQTVEALRARVRSLDPAYYEASFARDPVITGCRVGYDQTAPGDSPAMQEEPKEQPRPGARGLRTGGYMLGIGVVTFGVSLLLVSASDAFLIGMTVGAILFAIGLITVLISAIIMALAD
jgi:hypothetical protein